MSVVLCVKSCNHRQTTNNSDHNDFFLRMLMAICLCRPFLLLATGNIFQAISLMTSSLNLYAPYQAVLQMIRRASTHCTWAGHRQIYALLVLLWSWCWCWCCFGAASPRSFLDFSFSATPPHVPIAGKIFGIYSACHLSSFISNIPYLPRSITSCVLNRLGYFFMSAMVCVCM